MKRGTSRLLSFLLALCMVLSLLPATVWAAEVKDQGFDNFSRSNVYDNRFADIKSSAWYYDSVVTAYELGLMVGKSNTAFGPKSNITLAEAVAIACRILSIYTADDFDFENFVFDLGEDFWDGMWKPDVPSWCENYFLYGVAYELVEYTQFSDYNSIATRSDLAQIFGAMPDDLLTPVNDIADWSIPDVTPTSSCVEGAYKLYRAGVLVGSDSQASLLPDNPITRAEVAAIAARIAIPAMRESLTLTTTTTTFTLYSDNGRIMDDVPAMISNFYLGSTEKRE